MQAALLGAEFGGQPLNGHAARKLIAAGGAGGALLAQAGALAG
jgi:hypothetical protein